MLYLGLMQGRDDDNIDTIRRRFQVFQESSMPVVQYYEKTGKLRRVIYFYFVAALISRAKVHYACMKFI